MQQNGMEYVSKECCTENAGNDSARVPHLVQRAGCEIPGNTDQNTACRNIGIHRISDCKTYPEGA